VRPALIAVLLAATASAQPFDGPEDPALRDALAGITEAAGLGGSFDVGEDGTQVTSLVVVDLSRPEPVWGGVAPDAFLYPASVYKMYVAAEVLRQALEGRYDLDDTRVVKAHNAVDTAREVLSDPRPLLQAGDTVTVGYLLDLMVTRSDNSAANELIDLATRPAIDSLMHRYGWQGSEVTRKFLSRRVEDEGYAEVPGTMTSGRHAAEFLALAATDRLVHPWVSRRLMALLTNQLDTTKLAAGLPREAVYANKTGWWSFWTHDVGVVRDGEAHYAVALLTPLPEADARPRMAEVGAAVHALMRERAAR
jgi:beta-lactamase class A